MLNHNIILFGLSSPGFNNKFYNTDENNISLAFTGPLLREEPRSEKSFYRVLASPLTLHMHVTE